MVHRTRRRLVALVGLASLGALVSGFSPSLMPSGRIQSGLAPRRTSSTSSSGLTSWSVPPLKASDPGTDEEEQYSVATRLREEAESPYRNVRLFFYAGFAASAAVGGLTAFTGLLAGLNGVRGAVPVDESIKNLAIDVGATAISLFLWNLEQKARARKLDRMSMGARLASLKVQLQDNASDGAICAVSDFRRDRGQPKRVIVMAGKPSVVQQGLVNALQFSDRLVANNFLVVPVVLGKNGESSATLAAAQDKLTDSTGQPHVGLPILMQPWQEYLASEVEMATRQNIDAYEQGISIVLKLNGRVGQRAFGLPNWQNLNLDVEDRRVRGYDITSI